MIDSNSNPPPTSPRRSVLARRLVRHLSWLIPLALIVCGFCFLDGWFFHTYQSRWNTLDDPTDPDLNALTRPLTVTLRLLFAHAIGIGGTFGLLLVCSPTRRAGRIAAALLAVVLVAVGANFLQGAVGRLRPDHGHSPLAFAPLGSHILKHQLVCFPSGEAATAFAFATALACVDRRLGIAGYVGAVLVGASRLVNGAHYLSDIVAGAWLGTFATAWLLQRTPLLTWANAASARVFGPGTYHRTNGSSVEN